MIFGENIEAKTLQNSSEAYHMQEFTGHNLAFNNQITTTAILWRRKGRLCSIRENSLHPTDF